MPDTALEIQTLGRFRIVNNGKHVATEWPDETIKVFFCSMLSPLDQFYSWDRISRSMWGIPVCRLKDIFIHSLDSYLTVELGFNPLIAGNDGVRLDKGGIKVDAHEFYGTIVEGLRHISFDNHAAALDRINRAVSLYSGSHLPGIPGKINTETRRTLNSLYLSAINEALPLIRNFVGTRKSEARSACNGSLKIGSGDNVWQLCQMHSQPPIGRIGSKSGIRDPDAAEKQNSQSYNRELS